MKSIVQKNNSKEVIRSLYLSKNLISSILSIIEMLCDRKDLTEIQERVLESLLSIVSLLLPNRRKEASQVSGPCTNENVAVLNVLLKLCKKVREIKNVPRQKSIEEMIMQDLHKIFDVKNT